MKKTLIYLSILTIASCTFENTDINEENNNPVVAQVIIDTIPPPLDTLMFSKIAIDCFYHLGYTTGGEFYYKTAYESVHKTIIEVIQNHAENGSDIVFLIDKTGSMQNDIDSVRINLNAIIDQIEKFENIKLAAAVYGDKNVDGVDWWSSTSLTSNYQEIRNYINKLKVSDGGDYPESVYDGIAQVIENTKWQPNSKKLILVIGDAPSLEDSLSEHSRQSIIDLCDRNNVKTNLFPILVTPYKVEDFVDMSSNYPDNLEKVYPNPAVDLLNINLKETGSYLVTLFSLNGKVVFETQFSGSTFVLNIPHSIVSGNYILRLYEINTTLMNAEKIVISR
jgi:hypothetical protein